MEVEYNIQPQQKKQIERIYASTAHTFPLGIKMRLVAPIQDATNSVTLANALKLQELQERFLAATETRRIHNAEGDNSHNKRQLYDTLRAMLISSWQADKPDQPLFHAVSPMATKGGYLVRYLPQYRIKARAVVAQFTTHKPAGTALSSITNLPMDGLKPVNQCAPTVNHLHDKLEKAFRRLFTVPFGLKLTANFPRFISGQQPNFSMANIPSSHNLI